MIWFLKKIEWKFRIWFPFVSSFIIENYSGNWTSSPPSLITLLLNILALCSKSMLACSALLYKDTSRPIPFMQGQSDPTVDEHRWQFPCCRFPYHYVPMNHQIKYHFDCHLHPKSFARPAQLYKFADSGHCLGLSMVAMPYLLTIDRTLSSQPVISYEKGSSRSHVVICMLFLYLWHVQLTNQPLSVSTERNSNKRKFENKARCQWTA